MTVAITDRFSHYITQHNIHVHTEINSNTETLIEKTGVEFQQELMKLVDDVVVSVSDH